MSETFTQLTREPQDRHQLPDYLQHLSAPMQVWEYIWYLQSRVDDLETQNRQILGMSPARVTYALAREPNEETR